VSSHVPQDRCDSARRRRAGRSADRGPSRTRPPLAHTGGLSGSQGGDLAGRLSAWLL